MTKKIKQNETVHIRISTPLLSSFDAICEREHRKRTDTIRMLMEEYVKKMEESKD